MSMTAFWGDVAECRRLLRHYRRIQDEVKKVSPAWRCARRVVPWAVIPLLALPWWQLLDLSFWFGLGALSSVVFGSLPMHSPWKLTTFEALHVPSRRSLFVARVLPWLAWWLWGGLWGTTGLLLAYWENVQDGQQAVFYLLLGIQVPWLVLGVVGTIALLSMMWRRAGCAAWVMLVAVFPSMLAILIAQVRQSQAFEVILALTAPMMLLLEVGLLALQVWLLDRLEPARQISPLRGLQLEAELAQQKARTTWEPYSRGERDPLGPAPLLAGRHGLARATAYYACVKVWEGGAPGLLIRFFQYGFLLFPFMMLLDGQSQPWAWLAIGFLVYGAAMTGATLPGNNPQRLYLLGVDYRCQLSHRLKTFWMTPVVLVVGLGALLAWVVGQPETALALVALWAGLTLISESWLGWPALLILLPGRWGCLSQVLAFLVLAVWLVLLAWADLGLGSTTTRVQLFAAACGALGLAGILYKWWRLDEDRLAELVTVGQGMAVVGVTNPSPGPGPR
jgi:hypothetical protein